MNTEEIKSIKELFNVKFEALEKRMEDVKIDVKNEITNISSKQQSQIDVHCRELKSIKKEQGRIQTKLAVATTKLAFIISGIIFAIVFAFDRIADWFDSIIGG